MTHRIALWIILAAAAFLRFYRLEVPSLWWDEMVVPLTSRFPVDYIIDFSRTCEMHPPFFYIFMKGVTAAGRSDFALRLVPALFGTASVYLLYRVFRELFNKNMALIAAGLLAANTLQVWINRFVRPYSIILFLFILSLYFLLRFLKNGSNRELAKLLGVNAVLFCLHYFTFHAAFSEFLVMLGCLYFFRTPITLRQIAAFCAGTLAVAVPILVFFFLPSRTTLSIFTFKATYGEVGGLILSYLGMLFFRFDLPALKYGLLALFLAGAALMAKKDRRLLFVCLGLMVIPCVNQMLIKKTAYFSPLASGLHGCSDHPGHQLGPGPIAQYNPAENHGRTGPVPAVHNRGLHPVLRRIFHAGLLQAQGFCQ